MEAKGNPYREAAKEEMEKLNQSEHERYLYLRREMAISDEISRIQSAKNLGRMEGRKEGCAEGRADGELLVLIKQIKKKCLKGKTINQIVDELEETMEHITPVFNVINENPEESDEVLLELVKKLHN